MIQPVGRRPGFRHTSLSRRSPASGLTAESKLALDRTAKFRRRPIKAAQAESGAARGSGGSLGGSSRADRDRWFRPNEPGLSDHQNREGNVTLIQLLTSTPIPQQS